MENCLLIDDMRTFPDCVIARTVAQGIELIILGVIPKADKYVPWDVLYLDHDMGDFNEVLGIERTGMDVLDFLEEYPAFTPRKIEIVTSNAAVYRKMDQLAMRLTNSYGRV